MEYRNNFGNLQERYVYLVNKLADAFIEYNGDEPVDENEAHIWVSENMMDVFDERDEDIYYGLRILSSNPDQYGGGEYEFTQSLINDVVDVLISKNNKVMAKQQIHLNESSLKEMIREAISEYNTWRLSAPKDEYRNFVMHLIETDDAKEIASILLDSMEEKDIKDVVLSSDYFNQFRMNNNNSFSDKPRAVNIDEAIRKAINKVIK